VCGLRHGASQEYGRFSESRELAKSDQPGDGLFSVVAGAIKAQQGNRSVLPWCRRVRLPCISNDYYRQLRLILQQIKEIKISFIWVNPGCLFEPRRVSYTAKHIFKCLLKAQTGNTSQDKNIMAQRCALRALGSS